jgi:hypothetical protein
MSNETPDLLDPETPLVFSDGTEVYDKLAKKYITHKTGYYILAPSGSGKTYFVNSQTEKHWLDGDELWMAAKAHPNGVWWLDSIDKIQEIARRSDIITEQAKSWDFGLLVRIRIILCRMRLSFRPGRFTKSILQRVNMGVMTAGQRARILSKCLDIENG